MTTRRDFLRVTTGALGGALVAGCARAASSTPSTSAAAAARGPAARPIDLLVRGGTGFIGPHLVRHAVARGHRVTI
ncbi:MAG: hypothetical protein ACXW05_07315, partial [Gemmatirosa sp.]